MRVLVTGSSGFIGTTFCERFQARRGYDIVAVDVVPPRERFDGVEYVVLDLTDRDGVQQVVRRSEPQCIAHFAAQARVEPSLLDPASTFRTNILSTVNLLEAALELGRGLDRFLYASSETVYGPSETYPTPEDAPLRPQSPYAASKAASELLVRSANGLPYLILRSAMGYGPRSNPREQVVAKFLSKALNDEPILFPKDLLDHLHPTRDINHVQNYLDAVERAIDDGVEGVFNVGSGRETSILELARRIVELIGSGSVLFDGRFTYRPGEVGLRTWLDIRRAQDAFGYQPGVGLEAGLRSTCEWLNRNRTYWPDRVPEVLPLNASRG